MNKKTEAFDQIVPSEIVDLQLQWVAWAICFLASSKSIN